MCDFVTHIRNLTGAMGFMQHCDEDVLLLSMSGGWSPYGDFHLQ